MDAISQTEPVAFPAFHFAGTWRGYQARVLAELQGHLDDARLNIVAAPGAGKTVLGLEVLRRLGRPALVLSPTRAIRDQWITRLHELFQPEEGDWPAGLGIDLAAAGWLTSATYQSLHSSLRGLLDPDMAAEDEGSEEEEAGDVDDDDDEEEPDTDTAKDPARLAGEALLQTLERAGIETLVLDEAHHLRRAWWESLQEVIGHLKERRPGFHIVSLTATPPYDVEQEEWDRYAEVCGPIDAEISIPELVKQGDLCPHQDFLHFSVAEGEVIESLETFAREVEALARTWARDEELQVWVREFIWLQQPAAHELDILRAPDAYLGALSVARLAGLEITAEALAVLDFDLEEIPEPASNVLESLFQNLLDNQAPFDCGLLAERLRRDLRAVGALWRGKTRFHKKEKLARALAGTAGKLASIEDITRAELESQGEALRLVVLTDFVRSAALTRPTDQSSNVLGAGPILRRLGQAGLAPALRPALMTGSWVVIPDEVIPALRSEAAKLGLLEEDMAIKSLPHLPGWSRISVTNSKAPLRLRVITHLFEEGHLRCLIGTAALLGEGWDAPSINALVLATSVKSFMLSNQMRGRAIRVSRRNPDKVAAIWHLATILPPSATLSQNEVSVWERLGLTKRETEARGRLDVNPSWLGRDAVTVFRRFKVFAGVSHKPPYVIESGIDRLGIQTHRWTESSAATWNQTMLERAAARASVGDAWKAAFDFKAEVERPATGASVPQVKGHKAVVRFGTTALMAGFIGLIIQALQFSLNFSSLGLRAVLAVGGGGLILVTLLSSGAILRTLRAGSPARYMAEIGRSLLDSLAVADELHTPRHQVDVWVEDSAPQAIRFCRVTGGAHHDEVVFADAMVTFFGPIESPRYLLIRRHRRGWLKQIDYHAVPDAIGHHEAARAMLKRAWERRIGACELVNTRTRDGRNLLLRARILSYSAGLRGDAERKLRWE
ncbi:DEAD/DEAH box helicase family protein [Pelagibius sp.]|uniref:DEAD/DEAH box helicase family protein n=1 Tax=Pelagibius sp. TaxID=1931238 RepID=UPI003BB10E01